jgi:hypothetical protein
VLERREKLRQRMDDATTAEDAADDAARDDQP